MTFNCKIFIPDSKHNKIFTLTLIDNELEYKEGRKYL